MLTFYEYQKAAQRTSTHDGDKKISNGCIGLAGESGEVCDILKKHLFQGHELDKNHMIEELGDVLWYVAETCAGLGVTMEYVAQRNIDKLWKRYPEGFDSVRSVNRND